MIMFSRGLGVGEENDAVTALVTAIRQPWWGIVVLS